MVPWSIMTMIIHCPPSRVQRIGWAAEILCMAKLPYEMILLVENLTRKQPEVLELNASLLELAPVWV